MFIGTYENKIDKKGRVSVPAVFRQFLAPQTFAGIVAFPSYRVPAIEACSYSFMERLKDSIGKEDLFSDAHDALTSSVFAVAQLLPFDVDGRIILPPDFMEKVGITDRAAFVGKGDMFQIWQPEAHKAHLSSAQEQARERGLTIALRPSDGGGA
ncbi:MAG: division/cell wall cluster transcriptional repressor MraZ [Kiloniellales bacterium]